MIGLKSEINAVWEAVLKISIHRGAIGSYAQPAHCVFPAVKSNDIPDADIVRLCEVICNQHIGVTAQRFALKHDGFVHLIRIGIKPQRCVIIGNVP